MRGRGADATLFASRIDAIEMSGPYMKRLAPTAVVCTIAGHAEAGMKGVRKVS
jgi:hypothetical protein